MFQIKCDARQCYGNSKPAKESKNYFEIISERTKGEVGGTVKIYKLSDDMIFVLDALHACSWHHAKMVAQDAIEDLEPEPPEVQPVSREEEGL